MQKLIILVLIALTTPLAHAQIDKSIYCPKFDVIKGTLTQQWRYVLSAYNTDGNYFISEEQKYDANNGPALPIKLFKELVRYEPTDKKLVCVYYAYHVYNTHPELINIGDY